MADQYEIQSSLASQAEQKMFKNKQFVRIPDNNNGSYPSSQVNFNLSSLTQNDSLFFSAKQSYIEVPYTVTCTTDDGVYETLDKMQLMACFKNSFMDVISGSALKFGNQSLYTYVENMQDLIQFKILSEWSENDVKSKADTINWAKNDHLSWAYDAATASINGTGETTNVVDETLFVGQTSLYPQGTAANGGIKTRGIKTGLNDVNLEITKFTDATKLTSNNKCHVVRTSTTVLTYNIMALIPLSNLHDMFEKLPLTKQPYLNLTLYCNTNTTTITYTVTGTTLAMATSASQYGYNPILITTHGQGWAFGTEPTTSAVVTVKSSIGNTSLGTTCYFNACMYEMLPSFESNYINKMSNKLVSYNDVYTNSLLSTSSNINWQITSGLSKIRSLLVISKMGNNGVATPATNTAETLSVNDSPFTCGANFLGCAYTNMQIKVGNQPHYQSPVDYNYDMYLNEIRSKTLNGGLSSGLSSGLISQTEFESGVYNYVYVDLSRKESSDDEIPKSLTITATNNSLCARIQLYAFVEYEKSFIIDCSNSQLTL